jgi:hypothetical protein
MVQLCTWLLTKCSERSVKTGDDASRAADFLRAFLRAIQKSPEYGRNWLNKYGMELNMFLAAVVPDLLGHTEAEPTARKPEQVERELRGEALVSCAMAVFRGAKRGALSIDPGTKWGSGILQTPASGAD